MSRNHLNKLFILFILVSSTSCNKESAPDFVQTTGEIAQEERSLEDFNAVELYNSINLELIADTVNKVILEGGKNLLPDILTEVEGGKLSIKNSNKFNFLRSYKKKIYVKVYYKNLVNLTYRGAGTISCLNSIQDSGFTFDCRSGTGDVDLKLKSTEAHFNIHTGQCYLHISGKVGVNYIYQAGNAFTDAVDLQTGYTFVTNKGTNDLKINVDHVLFARISYLGNIYYKGNPADLSTEITDQGQLIKLEE